MRPGSTERHSERAASVVRVDPDDGATGVLCDAPVALRLSEPVDPRSVSAETVRVQDSFGAVPGRTRASADGCLIVWLPERPLRADVLHFVVASGLRDAQGRPLAPHFSRFVPWCFARRDLQD